MYSELIQYHIKTVWYQNTNIWSDFISKSRGDIYEA